MSRTTRYAAGLVTDLIEELDQALAARLGADSRAADWWHSQPGTAAAQIEVLLPQLPRRLGRDLLDAGARPVDPPADDPAIQSSRRLARRRSGEVEVDFGAWRCCDAGATILLSKAGTTPEQIDDLFAHGDFEERAMVMRSQAILPIDDATIRLFGEAQRTNTQDHIDALTLDSNLVARATDHGLPLEDFNRFLLKAAFVGMPLRRMFGAERHANATLSEMLQDLATEREAAGRKVWTDTARLIGRAPTRGTLARLLGALGHGDDSTRRAAVDGLAAMSQLTAQNRATIYPFLTERAAREPHPQIRTALAAAQESSGPS